MKRFVILLILFTNNFIFSTSFKSIYKENSPACVKILSIISEKERDDITSCGSGFIINSNGTIITNYHVIDGAKEILVQLDNNEEYMVQGFYVMDKSLDFVILKIAGFDLPTVKLGNSKYIEVGDKIATIGNPKCGVDDKSKNTLSTGDISQIFTNSTLDNKINNVTWLKLNAPISPGNSGGPLFNDLGQVIGVNSWQYIGDGAQNLNIALPINYIRGHLTNSFNNIKYPVDYTYVSDPWKRIIDEHKSECDSYDYPTEVCDCILKQKKDFFEHPSDIVYHENFLNSVNENCIDTTETELSDDTEWNDENKNKFIEWCTDESFELNICLCTYNVMSDTFISPDDVNWENKFFLEKLEVCNEKENDYEYNDENYSVPSYSLDSIINNKNGYKLMFNNDLWKIVEDFEEGLDGTLKYKNGKNIYLVAESFSDFSIPYENIEIIQTKMWEELGYENVKFLEQDMRIVNNQTIAYTKFKGSNILSSNSIMYSYTFSDNDRTIFLSIRCLGSNYLEKDIYDLLNGLVISPLSELQFDLDNAKWVDLEKLFIDDCLLNYSNSICQNVWSCTLDNMILSGWDTPQQVDWKNEAKLISIDEECNQYYNSENVYNPNNKSKYSSYEAESIIKEYLKDNKNKLDEIEGIWMVTSRYYDSNNNLLEEEVNWGKCGILKSKDENSPYDFIELVIYGNGFIVGEISATFNKTNKKNIYFSTQMDPDGNEEDVRYKLKRNRLTSKRKVELEDDFYYYESEYNKVFP